MAQEQRCKGRNVNGGPCGARAQPGRTWCQWHDPDREEEREQWRAAGGRARSHKSRAARELASVNTDMGNLKRALFRALERVETGELEPGVANSMSTIARAIVAVSDAVDVDARLAALEERIGTGQAAS